ncbi:MAG TPA: ABC transporter permease [Anaerolineaceae bacterium]|nr:ABC transporter permease [Anaerolineaceae bacterium]
MLAFYLSFKEIWRNRGRFLLFSLVIALITILVLFIAALAQGLATANKQFLEKLDAELLVFEKNTNTSIPTSQIGRSKLPAIRNVQGVAAAGSIGFSTATLILPNNQPGLDVALVGVDPNSPGSPPVLAGRELLTTQANEVVIDGIIASRTHIKVGDTITLKTIQDTKEKFFNLRVVGMTDGRQYLFQPAIFLPYRTWDTIRPQGATTGGALVEITSNIVAVKLTNPADLQTVAARIQSEVPSVQVVDINTAILSLPGYTVQQQTLNSQQFFTLLIGILVIGGFFQIQMLQKVPLIGVLKAIGASNLIIAHSVILQIVLVSSFGVLLGSLITFILALGMPPNVPILFSGNSILTAVLSLLLIGPLGGLVSVRQAIKVEPLIALGLSS